MKVLSYIVPFVVVSFIIVTNKTEKINYIPLKPIQIKELQESIKRGNHVYSDFCVSCHLPNGIGVEYTIVTEKEVHEIIK